VFDLHSICYRAVVKFFPWKTCSYGIYMLQNEQCLRDRVDASFKLCMGCIV